MELGERVVPAEPHRVPSEAKAVPVVWPDVAAERGPLDVVQARAWDFVEARAPWELLRGAPVEQGGYRCVPSEAKAVPEALRDVAVELVTLGAVQARALEFAEARAPSEPPRGALVGQGGYRCVQSGARAVPWGVGPVPFSVPAALVAAVGAPDFAAAAFEESAVFDPVVGPGYLAVDNSVADLCRSAAVYCHDAADRSSVVAPVARPCAGRHRDEYYPAAVFRASPREQDEA